MHFSPLSNDLNGTDISAPVGVGSISKLESSNSFCCVETAGLQPAETPACVWPGDATQASLLRGPPADGDMGRKEGEGRELRRKSSKTQPASKGLLCPVPTTWLQVC